MNSTEENMKKNYITEKKKSYALCTICTKSTPYGFFRTCASCKQLVCIKCLFCIDISFINQMNFQCCGDCLFKYRM